MGIDQKKREDFAFRFNKLMDGTGRVAPKPVTSPDFAHSLPSQEAYSNAASIANSFKHPAKLTAKTNKKAKASKTPLTDEQKQQIMKIIGDSLKTDDKPWYEQAFDTVMRPLDILARPGYSVVNALDKGVKASTEGEPFYSIGDDVAYGWWRGLSGQDKTGGGTLLQDVVKNSKNAPTNDWQHGLLPTLIEQSGVGKIADVSKQLGNLIDVRDDGKSKVGMRLGKDLQPNPAESDESFWDKTKNATGIVDILSGKNPADTILAQTKKWYDRSAGLGLDVALDPLTYGAGRVKHVVDGVKGTGKDAVKGMAAKVIDDLGPETKYLDDVIDPAAAKIVRENELKAAYKNGDISADDFLTEYVKSRPASSVPKQLKAGIPSKDVADKIAFYISPMTDDVVRGATLGRDAVKVTINERLDEMLYEVQGGMTKGRFVGKNIDEVPSSAAQIITEEIKKVRFERLDKATQDFAKRLKAGAKYTTKQIDQLKKDIPHFGDWYDEFIKNLNKGNVDEAVLKADKAVGDLISDEMNRVYATAKSMMDDKIKGVAQIEFMGKTWDLPRISKAFSKVKRAVGESRPGTAWNKAFNYTSNFPGFSSLLNTKARALSISRYEAFRDNVVKFAKNFTTEERRILQSNVENGIRGSGKMADAYDFITAGYKDMFFEEVSTGLRETAKSPRAANYAYTHVKSKKTAEDIKAWRDGRKATVKTNGNLGAFTSTKAKAMGHRIEEDAFKNLLYRKAKSQRDLARTYFYKDLVNHYGIKSKYITPAEMQSRNLTVVNLKKEQGIASELGWTLKPGEHMYMDKDIAKIYQNYVKLSTAGPSDEAADVVRALDYVTRKFKTMNTIYFPGYHIRNMIGDMFLGFLDGVGYKAYSEILGKWHTRTTSSLKLAGQNVPYQKMLDDYNRLLGAGNFYEADLGVSVLKPNNVVRRMSEGRENFGRFAHFYHAMDQEITGLMRRGKSFDKAYEQALISSIDRVNAFKFDYGALTPFEVKYMRRGFPFYTYIRKAAPLLMESMLMNPKYLTRINKMQQELGEDYKDMLLPDWIREFGYMNMGNNWGMSDALLPTATLRDAFTNPVTKLNPLLQVPIEAQSGELLYSNKALPTDSTLGRIAGSVLQKMRPVTQTEAFLGQPLTDFEPDPGTKTTGEKVFNFLGIPMRKIDDDETEMAYQQIRFNVNKKLKAMSEDMASLGLKVYLSDRLDGISIRVKSLVTDKVVWEGQTLDELDAYIKTL